MGLASCGGGDDRLTADELAAEGNGVCRKLATDVRKLAADFDGGIIFPPEQMQELFTKMLPLVDGAISDFKDLKPPEDLEANYAAALDQLGKDRSNLVAATKSKEAAKKLFDSQKDPFHSAAQKLAATGITVCAAGSSQGTTNGTDGSGGDGGTTETTGDTTGTGGEGGEGGPTGTTGDTTVTTGGTTVTTGGTTVTTAAR